MREKARAESRSVRYDGRWRDRDPSDAPEGVPPVIRLAIGFSKIRIGFNVNRIALAGACAAMLDQNYLEMVLDTVSRERQRLSLALQEFKLRVYPSAANFLLARADSSSESIVERLAEKAILVQYLPWPDENGSLRITIGISAENDALLNALADIL